MSKFAPQPVSATPLSKIFDFATSPDTGEASPEGDGCISYEAGFSPRALWDGLPPQVKKRRQPMPQPTKAIISNEQKSGIRKGSNRASTGKVGALLLSVYIV